MILVFADETVAYTGVCYRAHTRHFCAVAATDHAAVCAERLAFFEGPSDGGPGVNQLLKGAKVEVIRQLTRLFGHSIADLVALSNITGLGERNGVDKFGAALDILSRDPHSGDFRIEDDIRSPRLGMLGVGQPQVVCSIVKSA